MANAKLTADQKDKLEKHIQKWLAISFCTDPADVESATTSIKALYKAFKLGKPLVMFASSPPVGVICGPIINDMLENGCTEKEAVKRFESLRKKIVKIVRQLIIPPSVPGKKRAVPAKTIDEVSAELVELAFKEAGPNADKILSNWNLFMSCSSWVAYQAFISFVRDHDGYVTDDLFVHYETLSKSCYWVWCGTKIAIIIDRPEILKTARAANGAYVVHAEFGPAMRFRDGWCSYLMHDIPVPDWMALYPAEEHDPKRMLEIENAQQRSEFVRLVGIDRCFNKLAKIIDTAEIHFSNGVKLPYELGEFEVVNGSKRVYLKMQNPSVPELWHCEAVHPSCRTVQEAINYRATGDPNAKDANWSPDLIT